MGETHQRETNLQKHLKNDPAQKTAIDTARGLKTASSKNARQTNGSVGWGDK